MEGPGPDQVVGEGPERIFPGGPRSELFGEVPIGTFVKCFWQVPIGTLPKCPDQSFSGRPRSEVPGRSQSDLSLECPSRNFLCWKAPIGIVSEGPIGTAGDHNRNLVWKGPGRTFLDSSNQNSCVESPGRNFPGRSQSELSGKVPFGTFLQGSTRKTSLKVPTGAFLQGPDQSLFGMSHASCLSAEAPNGTFEPIKQTKRQTDKQSNIRA